MRIRFTKISLVLASTVFCALPFTLAQAASGHENGNSSNNGNDKVYVCHMLPNGKFNTQQIPEETFNKLSVEHPHEWILGECEGDISPSHPGHDH